MPILTKINNYDPLFVPATPLSNAAVINTITIKRSAQEEILSKSTNTLYTYTEDTYDARLYTNELPIVTNIIKIDVSPNATFTFILDTNDTVRTSYLVTVTSEDGTTTATRRIVIIDIGTLSPTLTVNTVTDNNFVTSMPKYYAEQPITVNVTTLNVGIIEVSTFDNTTQYFNLDVRTSDAGATVAHISKTGTDPNALNLHGTPIVPFNVDEDLVLDDNFVYLKISDGTTTIYFKLIQVGTITTTTVLDKLKEDMSNKWYHVFNQSTAVLVGLLTGTQIVDASTRTDTDLRTWLDGLNIQWFDVSVHLATLRDLAATQTAALDNTYTAFNTSNVQTFVQDNVIDLGASISGELFTIFTALPTQVQESYKHSINWFRYIRDRNYDHIVSPNVTKAQRTVVLSQAKSDYLKEFSHAAVIYKYVNKRYLEHFIRKLKHISGLISKNLLAYEVSVEQVDIMILGLENIKGKSIHSAAFEVYTESHIDAFINQLEYLKTKPKVIQHIEWVNT